MSRPLSTFETGHGCPLRLNLKTIFSLDNYRTFSSFEHDMLYRRWVWFYQLSTISYHDIRCLRERTIQYVGYGTSTY